MAILLDLPTEILWEVADTLKGHEISALARTSRTLYPKLRLALIKYNVRHQNSSALHWAAKTNDINFAKTLLSYRANVNALVNDCSPLMTAVQCGSRLTFKLFLKNQTTNVNLRNKAGKSALWYSVEKKSSAVVKRLLKHPEIEIDLSHSERQTVLWLAVFHQNRELVALLLSKGANPNAADQDGISPWIEACIKNKNVIKDLFLDHWNNIGPKLKSETCTGNAEMIRDAANNDDPGTLRSSGERMLRQWITKEEPPCILQLLMEISWPLSHSSAKSPLILDIHGNTPLWWATSRHHDDVTKRLLSEDDVDVNVVGGGGRYDRPSTSLHHAVRRLDTVVLQWLLAVPSLDLNICASFQSPLCLAIREGHTAVLRLLLTHKDIQINAQHPGGDAPLCLATENGNVDAVKLLVAQGSRLKINQLNRTDEETAVSIAIRNANLHILHVLLQHPDVDLNQHNRWGETALLIGVREGDIEEVKRLLQDPRPIYSLEIPAEIANSRKKHVIEKLIRGRIERNSRHGYYRDQSASI
ncbi:hypothetical protein MYU51_019539 [Penicillium brevicompactum]